MTATFIAIVYFYLVYHRALKPYISDTGKARLTQCHRPKMG